MTVIVGIAHEGNVYIGGDRGASDGETILSLSRPKICQRGEYVVGYAGSLGVGQLINMVDLPAPTNNMEKTLRTLVVKSLKKMIDEFGNHADGENATSFLIGVRGELYEIDTTDWQVGQFEETAVGSGAQLAIGSLYTSMTWKDQEKRLRKALEVSCSLSPSCAYPVDVIKI